MSKIYLHLFQCPIHIYLELKKLRTCTTLNTNFLLNHTATYKLLYYLPAEGFVPCAPLSAFPERKSCGIRIKHSRSWHADRGLWVSHVQYRLRRVHKVKAA